MQPWFILCLLLLGAFSGFSAGLLGIGGGALMVPFLTMLFTAQHFPTTHVLHMAVATSLGTVLFTSLSSLRAHHYRGAVLWKVVRAMGVGGFIGTLLGAQLASRITTPWLALIFAGFIAYTAMKMFMAKSVSVLSSASLPKPPTLLMVGSMAGLFSSLVGAGGGFITVPYLRSRKVVIHQALGTSAAIGFPIAAGGLVGYGVAGFNLHEALPAHSWGFIYLPALLCLASVSVLFAPLGARIAHALKVKTLQRIFSALLMLLASYMLYKSLSTFELLA